MTRILFACPKCERPLNVAGKLSGKSGRCPHCQVAIVVPLSSQIAPEEFRQQLDAWRRRQPDATASPKTSTRPAADLKTRKSGEPLTPPVVATAPATPDKKLTPPGTPLAAEVPEVTRVDSEGRKIADALSARLENAVDDPLQDGDAVVWYVRPPSGGQFGPASAALLRQWIQEGRVTGDSCVWRQGWEQWKTAGSIFPETSLQITADTLPAGNSDQVTATRTRTAYMKARRTRTMKNIIGLAIGTVIVIMLLIVLVVIINQRAV
jgi:hypothetical protein